ncbi:MAG: YifB family Mg chelatase-like AAA ATPase [Anaerovoracaceae bacterium]
MYSKVRSGTLQGLDAVEVTVESDVAFGLPSLNIVGLPDAAIRESKERVRTAVVNSGFRFPDKRITVNLSPADVRKEGSHLDLPIAVAILDSAMGVRTSAEDYVFFGELSLDGKLKPVKAVLPLLAGLRRLGERRAVIPLENQEEASLIRDMELYAAEDLQQVMAFLQGKQKLVPVKAGKERIPAPDYPDFGDVVGQETAKRALQTAAAGMHNLLMTGPPGCGKTFLARRLPGIMPEMTYEEQLEVTMIHSVYGEMQEGCRLMGERPFRAPDHTASAAALIGGGGTRIRAGEATLAHLGILFLDELPEFSRSAVEALRKPMEDEICTISRVSGKVVLPSKFLAVCSMNPCPCGYYGDNRQMCTCTSGEIVRYRSRLSGPFLDRIDMVLHLQVPALEDIRKGKKGLTSAEMRQSVQRAALIQKDRFRRDGIRFNSQMKEEHMKKYCKMDKETESLLQQAFEKMKLSVRSYDRVRKVARTLADLDGSESIEFSHAAEALAFKCDQELFR